MPYFFPALSHTYTQTHTCAHTHIQTHKHTGCTQVIVHTWYCIFRHTEAHTERERAHALLLSLKRTHTYTEIIPLFNPSKMLTLAKLQFTLWRLIQQSQYGLHHCITNFLRKNSQEVNYFFFFVQRAEIWYMLDKYFNTIIIIIIIISDNKSSN